MTWTRQGSTILLLFVSLNDVLLGAIVNDPKSDNHQQVIGGTTQSHHGGPNPVKDLGKLAASSSPPPYHLVISPPPETPSRLTVRRVDDTLNITCQLQLLPPQRFYRKINNPTPDPPPHPVAGGGAGGAGSGTATTTNESLLSISLRGDLPLYKLAWFLPNSLENSEHRVFTHEGKNTLQLIVHTLKESDAGEYKCTAQEEPLASDDTPAFTTSLTLYIKPRKGSCSESNFPCPTGECIAKRFVCDGFVDCKDHADESPVICGKSSPCDGKLRCEDGRCISSQWCCDRQKDINCTVRSIPSCCNQLQLGLDVNQYPPIPQHFNNDMGFLQTTIYTVIGCSMIFMAIITIMVIAICRVHLKRTALARYPGGLRGMNMNGYRGDSSWGNIFMQPPPALPYPTGVSSSGLLVTYNINNGVQIMGRPINPPPYSEVARMSSQDGQPPPYSSTDNLAVTNNQQVEPSVNPCSIMSSESSNINSNLPPPGTSLTYCQHMVDPDLSTLEPLLPSQHQNHSRIISSEQQEDNVHHCQRQNNISTTSNTNRNSISMIHRSEGLI